MFINIDSGRTEKTTVWTKCNNCKHIAKYEDYAILMVGATLNTDCETNCGCDEHEITKVVTK